MYDKQGPATKTSYPGTLKNTWCKNCGKNLNMLNAYQQEQHAKTCKSQTKMDIF